MKAIVVTAPDKLKLKDLPMPVPAPGQARIRTMACGICATDLEMIAGWERTSFPAIPGHEWSGIVDAVGQGGDQAIIGRHCVGENVLHDGGEVGFEHPGGYAGYFLTETDKLHFLPDDFPMAAAALIEPLAVATRALRRFRLTDKSSALVIGDGPLGLLLTILLKRAGVCGVTVTGGRENRLALAARLGAERTLNYHHFRDGGTGVVRKALGMSFPNIIEASGSAAAANMAVELASGMARVLFVGDYKKARTDFIWNHLLINELELIGSNASAQAWPEAVRTALAVQKSLSELISAEYPAGQFAAAFDALKHNRGLIKVILRRDR